MNCHNFKEVLDSYLSDELAVETNHAVLRHAELCPECRSEMAARRNLRQTLRGAVSTTTAPPDFQQRLRTRLREEALSVAAVSTLKRGWFFSSWLPRLAFPQLAWATAACAILLVGIVYLVRPSSAVLAAVSPALLQQIEGDHKHCAALWRQHSQAETDPITGAEAYDLAWQDLGKLSAHHTAGLTFHSAHVCGHYGRKYLHFVYSQGDRLISLFVADRDPAAMKTGVVPQDDGARQGLQQYLSEQEKFTVAVYQTSKHVVLTVSQLSAQENQELAEKLAKPISLHLRKIESTR